MDQRYPPLHRRRRRPDRIREERARAAPSSRRPTGSPTWSSTGTAPSGGTGCGSCPAGRTSIRYDERGADCRTATCRTSPSRRGSGTWWRSSTPRGSSAFPARAVPGAAVAVAYAARHPERVSALRIEKTSYHIDVRDQARSIVAPTLVLHSRGDAMIPFSEGRELAALIPDAEFVPSRAATTSSWRTSRRGAASSTSCRDSSEWMPPNRTASRSRSPEFTDREHEVLDAMARGLSNEEIADALYISPRRSATTSRTSSASWASTGAPRPSCGHGTGGSAGAPNPPADLSGRGSGHLGPCPHPSPRHPGKLRAGPHDVPPDQAPFRNRVLPRENGSRAGGRTADPIPAPSHCSEEDTCRHAHVTPSSGR